MANSPEVPVKPNGSSTTRFDPVERFAQLQREVERLWADTWPFAMRPFPRVASLTESYIPAIDVFEKNGNLVLKAELAGMSPEDIEITIEEGNLIVKGEKKAENEVKEKDYYRMERSYGSFCRTLALPEGIKPEDISAMYKDGVLEITMPRPAEKKSESTKIPIANQ